MSEVNYAFVKDGVVLNVAVFNNPSEELLEFFKLETGSDELVNTNNNPKAMKDGFWDGVDFIPVKPYSSWVLNSSKEWEAPVSVPEEGTIEDYYWDELTTSWKKIPEKPEGAYFWDSSTKTWESLSN